MKCLTYITKETNPYHNLALEELLFQKIGPDEVILYLWQNQNTVVIGRNQNAWRECRLEAFHAQEGRLARRLSGGGAVYHALGNLNFTFLAGASYYDVARQTEVICRAVQSFGIDAQKSGRNDILANGRKFSGNAYHQTARASFHHGTILISSDLAQLGRFLAPSPEKLQAKGVESVRDRVINLRELCPEITVEAMENALIQAFSQVYGCQARSLTLSEADVKGLAALQARYESEDWRLGRLSAFTYEMRRRFSFGELELLFTVEKGAVQGVQVFSDAMDADWVDGLEEALLGLPFTAEALCKGVPESSMTPGVKGEVEAYLREAL